MYAVMGVTGQVGGEVAKALLSHGKGVRAIVRSSGNMETWIAAGAQVAVADMRDAAALQQAFSGVEAVFVMIPPCFYPTGDFVETRTILAALTQALKGANVPKIVCLSSVGAHLSTGLGVIAQLHILEQELGKLPIPSAFVRAAWFMENTKWDIPSARESGEIASFLSPLDRPIPMVSTVDIGEVSAGLLQEDWTGKRYVELEGPHPYSPQQIAEQVAQLLGRTVRPVAVPRGEWERFFENQGAEPNTSAGRMEMLEGFNNGWITFEFKGTEHRRGHVTMEQVLNKMLHKE